MKATGRSAASTVCREEIEAIFQLDPHVFPDPAHSIDETRLLAIGRAGDAGRYIFAAFTLRVREGETLIRPISARYMHAKEIEHVYERQAKD
ncbi:MAG: BrnT family toxin [Tepidamorphaceae bacterium]